MKKDLGFTLLELMIAIAVLAIIVALGAPSFASVMRDNRSLSTANELVGAMQFARSEALRRRVNITVTAPGNNWNQGWSVAAGGVTIRQWDAPGNALVVTGNAVTFLSTGRASAAVTLSVRPNGCTNNQRRQVSINATGSVRVERIAC